MVVKPLEITKALAAAIISNKIMKQIALCFVFNKKYIVKHIIIMYKDYNGKM